MKKRSCTLVVALLILVVAQGCGSQEVRTPFVFWSPTPDFTQTPIVVEVVRTAVVVWTTTPVPTETKVSEQIIKLCVTATEAVHLRPSPSTENYPILQLERGEEVVDLGGRNSIWMFVQYRDKRGWVNGNFVEECE